MPEVLMSQELTVIRPAGELARTDLTAQTVIDRWIGSRSQETIDAYLKSLRQFGIWYMGEFARGGAIEPAQAIDALFRSHPGRANEMGMAFRDWMLEQKLAPATVNSRLAAIRSLVDTARVIGSINWKLEVAPVKARKFRDTRGPGREAFEKAIALAKTHADPAKAKRDVAILMLLGVNGLRVGEVERLELDDVDLYAGRIQILGKGRLEREPVTIAPLTIKALRGWIGKRGMAPGPLFLRLDPAGKGRGLRFSRDGIENMLEGWGERLGIHLIPHGLRHTAITHFLDRSNGDLRKAQKFARHSSANTTVTYDDNRRDVAGEATKLVATGLEDLVDDDEETEGADA